jgi:transcriptional regulator with XRE-family HTH domain
MEIHHKIRALREKKKFSQEYMAFKLEIGQSTYQAIEAGKSEIKLKHAIIISEILEIPLNELVNDESKVLTVLNNPIENASQQINNNIIENLQTERKDMLDFLKDLASNQLNKKDEQIMVQSEQINKLIKLLEK